MRNALIDSFTSMINGIKSTEEGKILPTEDLTLVQESIVSMFFFLEGLMERSDLQVNPDLAR